MPRLILGDVGRGLFERAPWLREPVWRIEAGLFGTVIWLLRRVAPARASAWGRRLLTHLGPRHGKHGIVRRNLALALPERGAAEIDAIARAAWGNIGAVLAEYAVLDRICDPATGALEVIVDDTIATFRDPNRPGVFVCAHQANWEVASAAIQQRGIPLTVVHSPLQNPYLHRLLERSRGSLGTRMVSREQSVRPFLRELSAGRSVGLVVDQRVDGGEPLPLFGIPKDTTLIPARLCQRFGAEFIPIRVERLGDARFRVTFHAPLVARNPAASATEQARDVMMQFNAMLESWIRERPGEWFCTKRRWPKTLWDAADTPRR